MPKKRPTPEQIVTLLRQIERRGQRRIPPNTHQEAGYDPVFIRLPQIIHWITSLPIAHAQR